MSELRFASEVVQSVVTYKAVLAIDNADLLLRLGMTATAEINVQNVTNALLVPNAALRYTPAAPGGDQRSFLQRLLPGPRASGSERAGGEEPQPLALCAARRQARSPAVEISATDGRRTQILSVDLKAGDKVITDQKTAARS